MIATTYQHDFIPPLAKRSDLVQSENRNDETAGCQCTKEYKTEAPKTLQKPYNVEWTGIAPMGRLIYPRNIPTKFSSEQLDAMLSENQNCQNSKNRFLKKLPAVYPHLYDRLKAMPMDERNRRLDSDHMYTTYQIDFCDNDEDPQGIYKSPKIEDVTSKLKSGKEIDELKEESPYNVMNNKLCEKSYKPFQISFVDSSRFINSGNSSHWRNNVFIKKVKFSEYMDTISKTGCAIMKNNIHDHQKCSKRNCRHKLVHVCTNMK